MNSLSVIRVVCIAVLAVLFLTTMVSASITTVPAGGNVYIGEAGLNISQAMGGDNSIAWFFAMAPPDSTVPDRVIDVTGTKTNFSVNPADFVTYTGNWYRWPAANLSSATPAFRAFDPAIDINIRDVPNDTYVSGATINRGTELKFRITSNLYTITDRGIPGAPITVRVWKPDSSELSALVNKSGSTNSLTDIPVSTVPYNTLPLWDTGQSAYEPGTYTVRAECNVNGMKDNYKNMGADYVGKTVSPSYTITLTGGSEPYSPITVPTVITSPGHYILQNDIINGTVNHTIEIRSSDVIFDGMNHTIDGLDGNMVYTNDIWVGDFPAFLSNITIKNVTLKNRSHGIFFRNVTNSRAINCSIDQVGQDGIRLEGSASLQLSGNTITNSSIRGISLTNSGSIHVTDNTVNNNRIGIYLEDSSNNLILHNHVFDNQLQAILLVKTAGAGSNNNTISYNVGHDNQESAIFLHFSNNNSISHNTIFHNLYAGVYLAFSKDNIIEKNTAYDSKSSDGIGFTSSNHNFILNNTLINNTQSGIHLHDSSDNVILGNDAYYNRQNGIGLIQWSGEGSNNNTVVQNNLTDNLWVGLSVSSSRNNTVSQNYVYWNQGGISLRLSDGNTVENNFAQCNQSIVSDGIFLNQSHGNLIRANTLSKNTADGIELYNSTNNLVQNNNITSNREKGILIYSSPNNTISNNFVENTTFDGIKIMVSDNNTLSFNSIRNSGNRGIYLNDSYNAIIYNNVVVSNTFGIWLTSNSSNNRISNNYFDNDVNVGNTTIGNLWNITKTPGLSIIDRPSIGGNYWSDYTGIDIDSDGIGDTLLPYTSHGNITDGGDWLPITNVTGPASTPQPPSSPVKLIFIHHSTGENWLGDENGGLGIALRDNNYFVSDTNYGWGPDSIGSSTDIGNWYDWFRGPQSPQYLGALYNESGQWSSYSRMATDPGGPNSIVMFKSCFPNSALQGLPSDPVPAIEDNPLKGNSSGSEFHSVANAKGIYLDLLNYFQTRPDTLFIVIAAPPLANPTYAANARAFNQWLVNDWLTGYTGTNVFVFDFYNVLTTNGGDADTNDLGLATGNHHRWRDGSIRHEVNLSFNTSAYPSGDDHPTRAGNLKATAEFIPLLNDAYNRWAEGPGQPVANFSANVTLGIAPLTVQFYDNSTGSPTHWNWSFGDGSFSELQNPSHIYYSNGNYTVALQVSNGGGFNSTLKSEYISVFLKGDFNNNRRVDIGDVTRVAYMAAGLLQPEDPRADFDDNMHVGVEDAARIAWYYVGKIHEL